MLIEFFFFFVAAIRGASATRGATVDQHLQWKFSTDHRDTTRAEENIRILPPGSVAKVKDSRRKLSNQWIFLGGRDNANYSLAGSSGNVIKFHKNIHDNAGKATRIIRGAICNKKTCAGDITSVAVGYTCGTKKRSCIDFVMATTRYYFSYFVMCPLSGYRMSAVFTDCQCAAGGLCNIEFELITLGGDDYYGFSITDNCSGTEDRSLSYVTLKCDPFP